jgi:hypothetical protein
MLESPRQDAEWFAFTRTGEQNLPIMSHLLNAIKFASFHEFDPANPSFRCVSPAPTQGRRCKNPVNVGDREAASRIRERIMSSLDQRTAVIADDDLRELAKLCCCKGKHRALVLDEQIMEQVVQKWRAELLELRQAREPASRNAEGRRRVSSTPQRASQRVTRARANQNTDVDDEPTRVFELYKTHGTTSMFDTISKTLTQKQKETGTLYCCSRPSDEGFYKHDCAVERTVVERVRSLQTCSGPSNLVAIQYSVKSKYAFQAKSLVQQELQAYHRREQRCLNLNCVKKHKGWFELDLNLIKRVMRRWSQWMNDANPYDDQGRLRENWKQYCERLEEEGTAITSSELYLAWQEGLVVAEDSDEDATDEEDFSEEEAEEPSCPVCLEAINDPARTACGHDFCSECIARVFETSNRCPMCRTELVAGEVPQAAAAEIPMENAPETT